MNLYYLKSYEFREHQHVGMLDTNSQFHHSALRVSAPTAHTDDGLLWQQLLCVVEMPWPISVAHGLMWDKRTTWLLIEPYNLRYEEQNVKVPNSQGLNLTDICTCWAIPEVLCSRREHAQEKWHREKFKSNCIWEMSWRVCV